MKALALSLFVFSLITFSAPVKKGEHELNMSAHEVSGVDRRLSTAEENRESDKTTSDASHRSPMDWRKRMQQDVQEMNGW